jgi:hypothetical protein
MSRADAFSIRIFVPDGDPDGLRMVERSNWIGKALVFPRSLLPHIKRRNEFGQTGVYVLIGPREEGVGGSIAPIPTRPSSMSCAALPARFLSPERSRCACCLAVPSIMLWSEAEPD